MRKRSLGWFRVDRRRYVVALDFECCGCVCHVCPSFAFCWAGCLAKAQNGRYTPNKKLLCWQRAHYASTVLYYDSETPVPFPAPVLNFLLAFQVFALIQHIASKCGFAFILSWFDFPDNPTLEN